MGSKRRVDSVVCSLFCFVFAVCIVCIEACVHIDVAHLSSQDLPSLPVPDLHKTLDRYLSALKPVIPVAQFEQTKRTVEHFVEPNGEGERLQAILQQYAHQTDNWV